MQYTKEMEKEYLDLFAKAKIRPEKLSSVRAMAERILSNKARYEAVGKKFDCPWWWVGCVHALEASCDFSSWLANGDPLTGPTVHVPKGLRCNGTWEDGARVSLEDHGMPKEEWDLGRCLYEWERYNGFGYRSHGDVSDYLWSFTDQERAGRYVADGKWDSNAWSDQAGCVSLLKHLISIGAVTDFAKPTQNVDADVAWIKFYGLDQNGKNVVGIAGNRDNTTKATWTGNSRKAIIDFLSRFPNAEMCHSARPDEAWPGEVAPPKPEPSKFPDLSVPFYPQLDNPRYPTGTCNVTSVAMVLAFFGVKPQNPQEQLEMEVLRWMEANGLDRHVHMDLSKAMQHYGLKNKFTTNASLEMIKDHLDHGFPVIMSGMFTSSGHIIVLTGYDETGFWVNDPYGEWFSSGYQKEPIASRGKHLHYSYNLILRVSGDDGDVWAHFPEK